MSRRNRERVLAAGAALVLLWPAGQAVAEEPEYESVDSQVISVEERFASGVVFGPNGAPVPGVEVLVRAWPTANDLQGAEEFTPALVGATRSDSKGRFVLGPDPAAAKLPQRATLEFVAITSEGPLNWFAPLEQGRHITVEDQALSGRSRGESVLANIGPAGLELEFQTRGTAVSESVTVMSVPSVCSLIQNYGPINVIVGQTYSTVSGGHTRKFTYTTGASSTVGLAVEGPAGSFSASGTTSIQSTATVGFPSHSDVGGRALRTQFTFGKFRCLYGPASFRNMVYPTGFAGGNSSISVANPTATYCVRHTAGATFSKSTTNAITWSNGVGISSKIGINLSSRTGYSATARADFTFSASRALCGQSSYPGSSTPYTIVVKP